MSAFLWPSLSLPVCLSLFIFLYLCIYLFARLLVHLLLIPTRLLNQSYVAERRTPKSSNQVSFGCGEFEEELAPSYCWKYVSTARSGATYEHRTLCLPATTKDRMFKTSNSF